MAHKLMFHQKPTFIHAVVTGPNTRENVANYLEDVLNECVSRKCFKVLIEERLDGPRLRTLDVY